MIDVLPLLILGGLLSLMLGLGYLDRQRDRTLSAWPDLTFVVPCYNDRASVVQTVASIRDVAGPAATVLVIDDGSTDGSGDALRSLQERLVFDLTLSPVNQGKSRALNTLLDRVKTEVVVFVDADVIVCRTSLQDALARLAEPGVGAVSCPYRAANRGFLAAMQTIEYRMLSAMQGAYNLYSAIALWGGFIVARSAAVREVGGFTANAITEDMDLAFKLNRAGWRVEQSFQTVQTYVPDNLLAFVRQKIRWSAGGFQCFVRYTSVWLRNPLHVIVLFCFCAMVSASVLELGVETLGWEVWQRQPNSLHPPQGGIAPPLSALGWAFSRRIFEELVVSLSFCMLSLPFVWPLAAVSGRWHRLLLAVPFSVVYVPVFSALSLLGAGYYLSRARRIRGATRGW